MIPTIPWKTTAAVVAVLALLAYHKFALYQTHREGYNEGYAAAEADTIAVYQPIIDEFNLERLERNLIIDALQKSASVYATRIHELESRAPEVIHQTTVEYIRLNPEDAAACGVTESAADSYNDFLRRVLP